MNEEKTVIDETVIDEPEKTLTLFEVQQLPQSNALEIPQSTGLEIPQSVGG